jgi:hypothetical protein
MKHATEPWQRNLGALSGDEKIETKFSPSCHLSPPSSSLVPPDEEKLAEAVRIYQTDPKLL